MLSKAKIKYIHSLELKKKRSEEHAFVAEGPKLVGDLLGYFSCKLLIALPEWLKLHPEVRANEIIEITPEELAKASFLKTPQEVLAVFEQKESSWNASFPAQSLCLALDGIQDSREFRYDYSFGRLVWHRAYLLLIQYGGCI